MKLNTAFRPLVLICILAPVCPGEVAAQGQEVGFVEKFALAEDRAEVLKELIPGTEEYYYYHALHFEHSGDDAGLVALLGQWHARNPHSGPLKEIKTRQALLRYKGNPKSSLDYIRAELGLKFDHRQDARDRKPNLPTALDPAQISRDAFFADAVRNVDNFGQLNDSALDWVVRSGLELNGKLGVSVQLLTVDFSQELHTSTPFAFRLRHGFVEAVGCVGPVSFQHCFEGGSFRGSDGGNARQRKRSHPDLAHLGNFKGKLAAGNLLLRWGA